MLKPAVIRINGRISNSFGGEQIDLETLQKKAIEDYLKKILPRAKIGKNVIIEHNATQNTRRKNWFSPQTYDDLPELKKLTANDTSVCVAHAPLSVVEKICISVEKYFWNLDCYGQAVSPKYNDIGQDIKVMVIRNAENINVDTCIPIFSDTLTCFEDYKKRIKQIEEELYIEIKKLNIDKKYNISININNMRRMPC